MNPLTLTPKALEELSRSPMVQRVLLEQEQELLTQRAAIERELKQVSAARRVADDRLTDEREKARAKLDKALKAAEAAQRDFDQASWAREHEVDRYRRDAAALRARLASLLPDRYTTIKQRIEAARASAHNRGSADLDRVVHLAEALDDALQGGVETFDRSLPQIESELSAIEGALSVPWWPPSTPQWSTEQQLAMLVRR